MLVFVDESGDPGFKTGSGSSPVFALAMVIFDDHAEAARTREIITQGLTRLGVKPEFKFSKCRADLRDAFFDSISECRFKVRALVVRKEQVWSGRLRSDPRNFHRFFLRTMMRFDGGALKEARIVVDGTGNREFKRDLCAYLKRHSEVGAIRHISLRSSRSEPLLQLTDMCVGAIARSYRGDRRQAERWRERLAGKIDRLWELE